jgi:hypothetical protein
MTKTSIIFDMSEPEDRADFSAYMQGPNMQSMLWDVHYKLLRNLRKGYYPRHIEEILDKLGSSKDLGEELLSGIVDYFGQQILELQEEYKVILED